MALNLFKLSLLCVAFFVLSNANSPASSGGDGSAKLKEFVVSLDDTNFTDYVGKNKFITVVNFYVSWSGLCKKFAPEFEKAAEILSKEDPPVSFAKVDARKLRSYFLADVFKVFNHPTIKISRNGGDIIQNYKGPLDANGILYFVRKEKRPATSELKSADEVTALVGDKMFVVVGIFPEFCGEKYDNFTTVANRLHSEYEYEIRHTSDAKIIPFGDSSLTGPSVRVFKPFDELFLDFQDFDVDFLENIIEQSSVATVSLHDKDLRNRPYMLKFFDSADTKVIMFINSTHGEQQQQLDNLKAKFHEVAKEYKGKGLRFSIVDVDSISGDVEFLTLRDDQVPLLYIMTDDKKTYVKANIEPDQISDWVMEFKEGKLTTFKKSESNAMPVPVKLVFKLLKNDKQKFDDIEEEHDEEL